MLFLYSAARLAGVYSSSGGVTKDVEAGDLFEGNTAEPKERSPQALSQVSKACSFLFTILVAISGLNLCAPNDRLGTALAKLALFLSLTLATLTFAAIWRARNTSPAPTPIATHGPSFSHLGNYANSFTMAAFSSVTILIVASHAQKPISFPDIGLSSQRQPSIGIALSKHPFGLEREMAKSASMSLKVHEQRLAALVGAANTEIETDQSDESDSTISTEVSEGVISPEEKAVKRRESYLDTVGDAPPVASGSVYATGHQPNDQREMKEAHATHDHDVADNTESMEKDRQSLQTSASIEHPRKVGEQESSSSLAMNDTETSTDFHGLLSQLEKGLSPTNSVDAPVPASKPSNSSKPEENGKEKGLGKEDAEDVESVKIFLASKEARTADIFPVDDKQPEFNSGRTYHSDANPRASLEQSEETLALRNEKTLKDLLVDSDSAGQEPQNQRSPSTSESSAANPSVAEEQTILIGPVQTESKDLQGNWQFRLKQASIVKESEHTRSTRL